jgi:hypothetical protein
MIKDSLQIYRQERKAFIMGLKIYYGIDFYKLDKSERNEWLQTYIESRKNFLGYLAAYIYENSEVEAE